MSENEKQLENFLHNIAWLRQHHGLSKRKMATLLHISAKTLNQIEAGEMPPRLSTHVIFYMTKHFGISPKMQFQSRLGETA